MRCPENPFQFGCICVEPHGISKPNVVRVFDTHLGAQGMEGIGELHNCLAPLLPQCCPSHVLVLIVANRVILFLYHIHKKNPSGIDPIYSRLLCGTLLPVSFPPMFDMGEGLKECEDDLFFVGKIVNREITF
jgi:hypothetical protein